MDSIATSKIILTYDEELCSEAVMTDDIVSYEPTTPTIDQGGSGGGGGGPITFLHFDPAHFPTTHFLKVNFT